MYGNNYKGPGIDDQPVPLYYPGGKDATNIYQQYLDMQLQNKGNNEAVLPQINNAKDELIEALGSLSTGNEEIYRG